MKKILLLLALAVTVMACSTNETAIKVEKTKERLELSATYPKEKQQQFDAFLANVFKGKDSLLLTNDLSVGKEIKLSNGAIFYTRYNPGKLEMEMLLERNDLTGEKYFDTLSKQVKKALE